MVRSLSHTSPLIETLVEDFQFNELCKGFDIKKSYANAVMNMEYNYPRYSICDSLEKYLGEDIEIGEYVLDDCVIEETISFASCWTTTILINPKSCLL